MVKTPRPKGRKHYTAEVPMSLQLFNRYNPIKVMFYISIYNRQFGDLPELIIQLVTDAARGKIEGCHKVIFRTSYKSMTPWMCVDIENGKVILTPYS